MKGYQNDRITAWLNPDENILGFNWDPHHARIAVGNGGWLGQGFMRGSQNQFMFLHEQHSDFPFPVFAEDWGFVGSLVLVALYMFLVLWCDPRRGDREGPLRRRARHRRRARSSSGTPSSTWGW